jgi:hypothetical protein
MDAYPLAWPPGRARSPSPEFSRFKVTLGAAVAHVRREVAALGGTELVISTNEALRRDGLPMASRRALTDAVA